MWMEPWMSGCLLSFWQESIRSLPNKATLLVPIRHSPQGDQTVDDIRTPSDTTKKYFPDSFIWLIGRLAKPWKLMATSKWEPASVKVRLLCAISATQPLDIQVLGSTQAGQSKARAATGQVGFSRQRISQRYCYLTPARRRRISSSEGTENYSRWYFGRLVRDAWDGNWSHFGTF